MSYVTAMTIAASTRPTPIRAAHTTSWRILPTHSNAATQRLPTLAVWEGGRGTTRCASALSNSLSVAPPRLRRANAPLFFFQLADGRIASRRRRRSRLGFAGADARNPAFQFMREPRCNEPRMESDRSHQLSSRHRFNDDTGGLACSYVASGQFIQ